MSELSEILEDGRTPYRFWRRSTPVLAALLGLLLLACNPNIESDPNAESGRDGERSNAQLMPLNTPINESVNLNESDMTDWLYFQIPGAGEVEITLGCDYTGAHCTANIRDEVGRIVHVVETAGQPRVTNSVAVNRGNYYVEVYVVAAGSDYTVQVDYEPN